MWNSCSAFIKQMENLRQLQLAALHHIQEAGVIVAQAEFLPLVKYPILLKTCEVAIKGCTRRWH